MGKRVYTLLGVGFALYVAGNLMLGGGTSGVFLGSSPVIGETSGSYQASQLPACVSAHTFESRGWGSLQTIRTDVWVSGCKDANGQLRLSAQPRCTATSFLGQGTVTCPATETGAGIEVVVNVVYPFGLNLLAGPQTATSFRLDSGGGYQRLN